MYIYNIINIIQFSSPRKVVDNSINLKNNNDPYLQIYDSLSLLEKIQIKNKINKIIRTYKKYLKRKNVSKCIEINF